MKNKALAVQTLFQAIAHMYRTDDEFRQCLNSRIADYAKSLTDKERTKFFVALRAFN